MKQDDEVPRAPVQHPVKLASVVAAELPEFAFHLGTVRVCEMRVVGGQQVEAVDLVEDRDLPLGTEPVDEVLDRLGAVWSPVVHGLERLHPRTYSVLPRTAK
jgi:hypothetical protein